VCKTWELSLHLAVARGFFERRAEAIEDRGREVVLVTRASGRRAARSCRSAATGASAVSGSFALSGQIQI